MVKPVIEFREIDPHGRVYYTDVEINRAGHELVVSPGSRPQLISQFNTIIRNMLDELLRLPNLESLYINSYSVHIAIKKDSQWEDDVVDEIFRKAVNQLIWHFKVTAKKGMVYVENTNSQYEWWCNYERFCRPIISSSQKSHLGMIGERAAKLIGHLLTVRGIEEVETHPSTIAITIAEYVPFPYEDLVKEICEACDQFISPNIVFEAVKKE